MVKEVRKVRKMKTGNEFVIQSPILYSTVSDFVAFKEYFESTYHAVAVNHTKSNTKGLRLKWSPKGQRNNRPPA